VARKTEPTKLLERVLEAEAEASWQRRQRHHFEEEAKTAATTSKRLERELEAALAEVESLKQKVKGK
jgi:hypothetical protein